MPKSSSWIIGVALAIASFSPLAATAGQVNVGVNIGVPAPPPIVLPAPPPVVVVPNSPVSYVPSVDFNLFLYGGRYYSFHQGSWFYASRHSGPWTFIPTERVPRPVIGVPATYYKVPPGHARKMANAPSGAPPAGHGCPPGLAKQGRC
jgi:hypothetical protein